MKRKLLFAALCVAGALGCQLRAQNLLSSAIPTVDTETYFTAESGWKLYKSNGTELSSNWFTNHSPNARVRTSSATTHIKSGGSTYGGSHFLIRWDGSDFAGAYYTYPVELSANKFYTFTMELVHWNNDNTNIVAAINEDQDGRGTTINSVETSSVNSTNNGGKDADLKAFTFNARIDETKTYYVTFKNKSNNGTASKNPIYCIADNLSLVDADITVYESNWQTAYDNAVAARDNSDYNNITGNERTDLQAEIDKAKPTTKDGYFSAMVALENATATFTGAKSAYDYYKGIKDENTAMGANLLAVEPTTAAEATAGGNTLKVNQYNYVSTTYTGNVTDLYVGSWTTRTNFDEVENTEHWSGNETTYYNKWAGSGTTSTLSQTLSLPAGSYVLKVAGRGTGPELSFTDGSVTKYFQLLGGEGLGITKTGVANYTEAAETYANDNKGYGWEWRFIKLTLAEAADVTVTLKITRTSSAGWGSFSDFTVLATPLTESLNRYNLAYSAATAAKANGTYANVLGGSEEAALTAAIAADASVVKTDPAALDEARSTLTTATTNFTNAVTNYDRLAAALAEASSISYDGSSYAVTSTTTSSEALSNANALYSEMFSSLTSAKPKAGKVIGFEADEYAPYKNVAILAAWKLADAITTVADASTDALDAAITALNGASWASANAEELNAVYDGTFASATNNKAPLGWTMTGGTLGDSTNPRALVGNDNLSEFNETKSAFYIRYDGTGSNKGSLYKYGETDGYTMPLKENTWYSFKADFASWGDKYGPLRINVKGPESYATNSGTITTNIDATAADNTPQQFYFFFKTGTAGDYTFNIQNDGASKEHKAVITNFELFKCPAASATMSVKANKWGTFIAPFDVEIPTGVNAYTVTGVDGTALVKSSAIETTIPANTPVILENTTASLVEEEFEGQDISKADSYTEGLLTGVYTAETIAASVEPTAETAGAYRYVLQTQGGVQAFYKVISAFTTTANRCYLSVSQPATGGGDVKAFFFDGDETAVSSVKADELQGATIYNLAGQRVSKAQKGVYIINGKKVAVK